MDLAVIESRWWPQGNHSVKQTFDTLAGVNYDNPFDYHYEMFNNSESLQEIIPRVAQQRHLHYIYIAAHGCENFIAGAGGNKVSRTKLTNILKKLTERQLIGLYFGSCGFGKQTMHFKESCNMVWVAGFSQEEIGWIDSASLDLFFWNSYHASSVTKANVTRDLSEKMLIYLFCLRKRVPYMFDEMGLRVSLRTPFKHKRGIVTFPDDVWNSAGTAPQSKFKRYFSSAQNFLNSKRGQSGCWP